MRLAIDALLPIRLKLPVILWGALLPASMIIASPICFATELPAIFTVEQQARSFEASNGDATIGKPVPARVRLPLRLVTFQTVVATDREGKRQPAFIPRAGVFRTIRARIDKPNHFFVGEHGEWHVETVPVRFAKADKRLTARLNISKQVDRTGTVEEFLGSLEVTGMLVQEEAGVYNLVTSGKQQFRDQMGNPVLDLSVGMSATVPGNTSKLNGNQIAPVAKDSQEKF